MNRLESQRTFSLVLLVSLATVAAALPVMAAKDLGVGCYGLGWEGSSDGTILDVARHDWVMVLFPQPEKEVVERLNRCFEMNPRMKVMLRLWFRATYRRAGDGAKAAPRPVRFLDYLYHPEAKAAFLEQAFAQVDLVMKNAAKPENVYGFTFFQDQPGPLAPCDLLDVTDPDAKPDEYLLEFSERYERETGRKMERWNRELRIWWSRRFAAALRDMYGAVKARYPQLKGFTYFVNRTTSDFLEPGEDVHSPRTIAAKYADVIGPGGADGFYVCRQNAYWAKKYRELAEANGWYYFHQLSHTANKRLSSWKDSLAFANDPSPYNVGYFHYERDFVSGCWNDDPDLQTGDLEDGPGCWNRTRRCLAAANVGMDVVRRYLTPEVTLIHSAGEIAVGDVGPVAAEIVDRRTEAWFADPGEAVLRNVRVRLSVPAEYSVPERYSVPAEIVIPELKPGERRSVYWWIRHDRPSAAGGPLPFAVEVESEGVETARAASDSPVCRPDPDSPFRVARSGDVLRYHNFGMGRGKHPVEISLKHRRRSHSSVIDPFFEFRGVRIGWRGEVPEGATLTIRSDRTATLTDAKGGVLDVSSGVLGRPFQLRSGTSEIRYFDNAGEGGGWKAEICLKVLPVQTKTPYP